ncbi:MAG: glycosyltransferase [Rikenellaceae bacterium]|nr:glycosyltransferase [Rikenellaceae bacterium]
MKIAILSPFYPYRGGIAQFSANLFEQLSTEHEVLPFNFTRQYPDFLFPGKTQYVSPNDNATKMESIRVLDSAWPGSYIKTANRINREKPDLLIIRYWMSYFGPSLGYVARNMNKNTKVVAIMDNVTPHEPRFFDKPFTKYFMKGVDGFVTMCEDVKRDLLSYKPDAKNIVIPHPLYTHFGQKMDKSEACKILGLDPNKKTLLFFGLIREYKGLDILIDAFDKLSDGEQYQLLIAGEPYGSFEPYAQKIQSCQFAQNIHCFTNYIDDSEVPLYFSAADVCVLPYRSATQSGIASVAYHFEVPMITTDVGGLRETVADTGTGIVVEKADPQIVADGIKKFFTEYDHEFYQKNFAAIKQRLSWKTFADKLLEFADSL